MSVVWDCLPAASVAAGYLLGSWWATRLTRAERRLVKRYLYYSPVVDIHPPGSIHHPAGDAF